MIDESRWYQEGFKAFGQGLKKDDCPYAVKSAKWFIWVEGWEMACSC